MTIVEAKKPSPLAIACSMGFFTGDLPHTEQLAGMSNRILFTLILNALLCGSEEGESSCNYSSVHFLANDLPHMEQLAEI